jgi:hypothetical protein
MIGVQHVTKRYGAKVAVDGLSFTVHPAGMLRNTAGGIAAFVGLLFVLPGISAILPSSVNDAVSPYLPLNAGTTLASHTFDNPHHLSTWGGFALFCGYTAVALIGAAVVMLRRDA